MFCATQRFQGEKWYVLDELLVRLDSKGVLKKRTRAIIDSLIDSRVIAYREDKIRMPNVAIDALDVERTEQLAGQWYWFLNAEDAVGLCNLARNLDSLLGSGRLLERGGVYETLAEAHPEVLMASSKTQRVRWYEKKLPLDSPIRLYKRGVPLSTHFYSSPGVVVPHFQLWSGGESYVHERTLALLNEELPRPLDEMDGERMEDAEYNAVYEYTRSVYGDPAFRLLHRFSEGEH